MSSLLPLLLIVAVIVLIARRSGGQTGTGAESAGAAVRRFFQYLVMMVALVLGAIGVAGLIDAVATSGDDTAALARSIAFVLVGLPVFLGLALFTRKKLTEPAEVRSLGWAVYLTMVLIGSLIAVVSLASAFFGNLASGDGFDRNSLVSGLIWAAVWAGHWWAAQRRGFPSRLRIEHLLGSAVGLISVSIGAAVALPNALVRLYDTVFDVAVTGRTADQVYRPAVLFAVGVVVWGWYWLNTARRDPQTPWWNAYVLLLGVLGGFVMAAAGAGIVLGAGIRWFLPDTTGTAAGHFEPVALGIGIVAVGAVVWVYHRWVLGARPLSERSEVDRLYEYLLAGAGLGVLAAGVVILIGGVVQTLAGETVTAGDWDTAAVALTMLIVGTPVWWTYWAKIRRARRDLSAKELTSTTRRVYLFLLFGVSALVALVSLTIFVYQLIQDGLDAALGKATFIDGAIPIALVLTAGLITYYHWLVFRRDRLETPAAGHIALREVLLVTPDGDELSAAIRHADVRVRIMHAAAPASLAPSADDVVTLLLHETHHRAVVVDRGAGDFEVVPLD